MALGTTAKCGHRIWAIGAEGSIARLRSENSLCQDCQEEKEWEEKKAETEKKEAKK